MEVVIYYALSPRAASQPRAVHPAFALRYSGILLRIAMALAFLGLIFLAISYGPAVWFWANSLGKPQAAKLLAQTAQHTLGVSTTQAPVKNLNYQPLLDSSLPADPHLRIVSIGVDTTLQEATYVNYEAALKKGVWRVADFGTPADRLRPTILAAHRFGYLSWSNQFRRQNSFYNLPKLAIGSIIEIDWQQRKYLYEVYAEGQGEAISDYSADLILYTCEDLTGPVRIFRYAKLLTT